MSHDALIDSLSRSWQTLAGKYTPDTGLVHKFFLEIQTAYSSPNRYYHNLYHIQALMDLSGQYAKWLSNKDLIDFAIFYHDVIYNVSQLDNEEKSAEKAKDR